ncbi:related to integral membrane protein PTH11 [Rhynchosporium agropyri]|uniref:Related to integral membrane protein PTH11 n=1 Tax=Rhynchosporium agropyri TaxID=914238 RepID=A0A1E1L6V3_9HELO|nr:related to integral membrane protein PTH11 [Rhynchosporium agropyri]
MAAVGLGQVTSWYICTIVAVFFLSARLVVKWIRFKAFSLDDGFLGLAGACLVTDLVIQQHMWNLGMATPQLASRAEFEGILQMIIPGSIAYVTSLWAIKVALVIFYKRIAARTRLQTVYNVVLGVLAVTWAVIFFDIIFQCYPIERKWTSDPNNQCSKKASDINYWITILSNILLDVVIIILPISMVAKLQMPLKQKLGVGAMFALGFFVIIASIIRAYYSSKNETMLTCTVSMVETAVAIIATCLPALRVIILGQVSRVGTSGPHYELGSSRHTKVQASVAAASRHDNYLNSGHNTSKRANDSEDELVKDTERNGRNGFGMVSPGPVDDNAIAVTTEFQVREEDQKEKGNNRKMVNF